MAFFWLCLLCERSRRLGTLCSPWVCGCVSFTIREYHVPITRCRSNFPNCWFYLACFVRAPNKKPKKSPSEKTLNALDAQPVVVVVVVVAALYSSSSSSTQHTPANCWLSHSQRAIPGQNASLTLHFAATTTTTYIIAPADLYLLSRKLSVFRRPVSLSIAQFQQR
ncbi:LAME_0H14620g1_1 [Lachancea meyersii CBS 8951]|uniref:LAME_0H14620g1_1 n=1 Tax=Lachancea meyersii CBS 8951 TaxID=1266667 RepID=A0A1G4KHE4_9SACH|nr:LAME_0H14620g1_1 [Lachancea meyersii CBS 8951]